MAKESRVNKSILNARVNLLFIFLSVLIAFFSRKIFINSLGVEFVGLTSTFQSVLGFLNLAELGIGTAIGVSLYKPLADNDHKSIDEIVSVLAFMYSRIGLFILSVGVIISLFLPLIFSGIEYPIGVVYTCYYAFLFSSLITYFINYKQTLLSADQKNYVVTKYLQISNIIKLIIQIVVAYYYSNMYLWIVIEFVFSILYSIVLNVRINQTYPWLKANIQLGRSSLSMYPQVIKYIKQLFVHKIASFTEGQVTPFLVFAFVSLKTVTYYSNYITVVSKLGLFVNALLGSTEASVGNLIADKDTEYVMKIYKEMMALRFFIAGAGVFLTYHLIESFITLWLGEEFVLSKLVLILILLDVFISHYRGATDQFLAGYALFSDIWSPIAEVLIFFIVALVGGFTWGLEGILLGSIVSKYIIVGLWKPYFLFKRGFKESVLKYWLLWLRHICIIALSFFICSVIYEKVLLFIIPTNMFNWFVYAAILSSIYVCVLFVLMWCLAPGVKSITKKLIFNFRNNK